MQHCNFGKKKKNSVTSKANGEEKNISIGRVMLIRRLFRIKRVESLPNPSSETLKVPRSFGIPHS